MNKLTIEEKAKVYDGAKRTNELSDKDEKLRNTLIRFHKSTIDVDGIKGKDIIAWLEKQINLMKALQISNAKIGELIEENYYLKEQLEKHGEPKFKVGDWVVNNNGEPRFYQVIERSWPDSKIKGAGNYLPSFIKTATLDKQYHLWAIQDAKDGNVLACENGWTCIFKKLVNDETFSSYCFMDNTKWFCETGSECHTLKEEFVKAYNGKIYPATKEQRSLLFQKMREAGYEWDDEKKVLKKIEVEFNGEDYGIDGLWHAQNILEKTLGKVDGYQSDDGILEHKCAITAVKKLYKQKSVEWSWMDKQHLSAIIKMVEHCSFSSIGGITKEAAVDWLKFLKERIVQPK